MCPSSAAATCLVLAAIGCGRDPVPTPASPVEAAAPTPAAEVGRVVIVAVDGATWSVMDPMMTRGELPTFSALAARGCRGAMTTLDSSISSAIWTSVATGVPPEEHGIVDFAYERDGRKYLFHNDQLRAAPLWERLSDAGVTVGATNWWVSYPVVPVQGFLISDHFIPSRSFLNARTFASADAVPAREPARLVYPPALWDALVPALRRRLPDGEDPAMFRAIDETFANDAEVVDLTLRASASAPPRVTMLYLKGIDILSHFLWGFYRPNAAAAPSPRPRDVAVYSGMIEAKYRHTDALLAELTDRLAPEDLVIVLSDHGFGHRRNTMDDDAERFQRGFHRGTHGPGTIPPSEDGIYLVAGGPLSRARCPTRISLYDVAPTVLYLTDQPVPASLPGRPLLHWLDRGFVNDHPVRKTDRPDPPRTLRAGATPEQTAAEERLVEGLRALGYFDED